jgi:hypothetical protein
MTIVNDVLVADPSNFMGLPDGEVDIISQEAVTRESELKQARGLPNTVRLRKNR